MSRHSNQILTTLSFLVIAFFSDGVDDAFAQGTNFTYQGKLADGGTPVNGSYDLQFKLFDTATVGTGTQQGATLTVSAVLVTSGIFTVQLDFGVCASCFNGPPRFLEIAVKPSSGGSFTTLGPRQAVTSNPYAIKSLNSATADGLSVACINCVTSSQIASAPAGTASSYIQNTTTQQPGANFNISGNGTAGGTLTGNVVNATTQYNIAGTRFLSGDANNIFAGTNAGNANTTGFSNSFFGRNAGVFNTTGANNSFFGENAGAGNSSGSQNAYFGKLAFNNTLTANDNAGFGYGVGASNSTGSGNSFFGSGAGAVNTTGSDNLFLGRVAAFGNTSGGSNTIIGATANVASGGLNFATAIGAGAVVSSSNTVALGRAADTVQIPGNLNVVGTIAGNFTVPASNITGVLPRASGGTGLSSSGAAGNVLRSDGANWTSSALQSSDIPNLSANYIQNSPAFTQFGNFLLGGDSTVFGTLSGTVLNAFNQINLNGSRVLSGGGTNNLFVGVGTASAITTGSSNAFFGTSSGSSNTSGALNAFFGRGAGLSNTTGDSNAFFGESAGVSNTTGSINSFFGWNAGALNMTGTGNSFFGKSAGFFSTTGSSNAFFGTQAGANNSTGNGGVFVGVNAGSANTIEDNNTFIGNQANGVSGITNATSIGNQALVTQSNSLVLGNNVNVGIGTTAPIQKLHVDGNEILSTGSGAGFKFRDRGSSSSADDWVWYSNGNVARFFRPGAGDLLTITSTGVVSLNALGSAGGLNLCRNLSNQISNCSSSIRYKTNIARLQTGLQLISRLRPVIFDWKQSQEHDLGLVAEEVANVEPLLTTTNSKGEIEGVKYDRVGVVLVNAVQEQQLQIESLEKTNQTQQKQIETQQKQIDSLKQILCSMNPQSKICKQTAE